MNTFISPSFGSKGGGGVGGKELFSTKQDDFDKGESDLQNTGLRYLNDPLINFIVSIT